MPFRRDWVKLLGASPETTGTKPRTGSLKKTMREIALTLHPAVGTSIGAALLLLASACSPTNAASGDGGADAEACPPDAYLAPLLDAEVCNNHGQEVDLYYPCMTKAGTMGKLDFVLETADPAPPSDPLQNTWVLKVVDHTTGAVVKDAMISLPVNDPQQGWLFPQNPWMPFMKHGGTQAPTVTNHGDGTATATPDFSMHDYWQTFVCAQSGSTTDCATFSFCLP